MTDYDSARHAAQALVQNLSRALVGKERAAELAVSCLLARGHLLLEDVPGVGKTTLARALAASAEADLQRIQFTSDLMPSDVVGGNLYEPGTGALRFRPGPVFCDVLLADEINRAPPKTQSALLEAMEERQVSVEGETRPLSSRFFVVATQNPLDFHGTHPLPESQLDRFALRLALGPPPPEAELGVLRARGATDPVAALSVVVDAAALESAQAAAYDVKLSEPVLAYAHAIVLATRRAPTLAYGVSTRGALSFVATLRAFALVRGRDHVLPGDVRDLAIPALVHRVRPEGAHDPAGAREAAELAIGEILDQVAVPV